MKLTEKQSLIISSLGYDNPQDFLTHYPFRYDFLFEKKIDTWESGEQVVFSGRLVSNFSTFRFGKNQSKTTFKVLVEEQVVSVTLFNLPFLKASNYDRGIVVIGHVQDNGSIVAKRITNQDIKTIIGIQPVYPTKTSIKQHEIKRLIDKILKHTTIDNVVPDEFINAYKLLDRDVAIKNIHHPQSKDALKMSLRTLKYEEFLLYHLVNGLNASTLSQGISKAIDKGMLEDKIKSLPYTLTEDQRIVLDEIIEDLSSKKQMHRLLQGDVGSGKTIVALLAAYLTILDQYQVAFMVPTEILLEQHFNSVKKLFPELRSVMLSSSMSNRSEVLDMIKNNEVDIVVGTHALFQEDVIFSNLGMVIIDEQHRFGVHQRRSLIDKGEYVDTLMLSATPIPRSLASALFFNLDISTIATYPAFRKVNKTVLVEENSIRSILEDLEGRLVSGDQIYVVCAAIDESERKGVKTVEGIYAQFKNLFPSYKIGKIHSRIDSDEKEAIMRAFNQGDIDILISTTIIEVGIDVHNANTMIIYNAELFGLSTLHQLRGRIGRGTKAGILYLLSNQGTEESQTRLKLMASSNDGFELSMMDMKMRGMGDLLGNRQSGLPHFILGDIEHDQPILIQAKVDAEKIIENQNAYKDVIDIAKGIKMLYN